MKKEAYPIYQCLTCGKDFSPSCHPERERKYCSNRCTNFSRTYKKGVKHHGFKHGGKSLHSKEYTAWRNMKSRCYNSNDKDYVDYGGRRIIVCERWKNSFEHFFMDMGNKPSLKHWLDRFPNMNGDYELENCRWATTQEQQLNKRNNQWYVSDGIKKTVCQWADFWGVSRGSLHSSIKRHGFEYMFMFYKHKQVHKNAHVLPKNIPETPLK